MPYAPESAVLCARDPALTNSDDWPIFTLTDVTVIHPSSTDRPANLLHADAQNALSVQGRLETLNKSQAHLLKGNARQTRAPKIEIQDVRQFAYGQYGDGSIDIWAAGQAGWFALKPARRYKEVYAEMVEAIDLLYFSTDIYGPSNIANGTGGTAKRKRGRQRADAQEERLPGAAEVFSRFAALRTECEGDPEVAAGIFRKHRRFLLTSMLAGGEGLNWTKNPLFRYLGEHFPVSKASSLDYVAMTDLSRTR